MLINPKNAVQVAPSCRPGVNKDCFSFMDVQRLEVYMSMPEPLQQHYSGLRRVFVWKQQKLEAPATEPDLKTQAILNVRARSSAIGIAQSCIGLTLYTSIKVNASHPEILSFRNYAAPH